MAGSLATGSVTPVSGSRIRGLSMLRFRRCHRHAHRAKRTGGRRVPVVLGARARRGLGDAVLVATAPDDRRAIRRRPRSVPGPAGTGLCRHEQLPDPLIPHRVGATSRAGARRAAQAQRAGRHQAVKPGAAGEGRGAGPARLLGRPAKRRAAETPPFDVRIGTFNVLGSQHTAPGGDRQKLPARVDPLRRRGRPDRQARRRHPRHPGAAEPTSSPRPPVPHRHGRLPRAPRGARPRPTTRSSTTPAGSSSSAAASFTIPFMGRPRPQPILKLRCAGHRSRVLRRQHPPLGRRRALPRRAATGPGHPGRRRQRAQASPGCRCW